MNNNKQSIKLYTEKDIANAVMFGRWGGTTKKEYEDFLKKLTPIELPSDEEIDEMSKSYIDHINTMVHKDLERDGYLNIGFLAGAKNIIDKIKGDNK